RLPCLATARENWRDMTDDFQVPGENQRAPRYLSLWLAQ
ncbi:hypothetical protein A2U01_0075447, partial [Trifolium medium]|nr:hypothetical protein [Trifolium medium]